MGRYNVEVSKGKAILTRKDKANAGATPVARADASPAEVEVKARSGPAGRGADKSG